MSVLGNFFALIVSSIPTITVLPSVSKQECVSLQALWHTNMYKNEVVTIFVSNYK